MYTVQNSHIILTSVINMSQSDHMTVSNSHLILTSLLICSDLITWLYKILTSYWHHIDKLVDMSQSDHMTVWNENSIDEYWKDFKSAYKII